MRSPHTENLKKKKSRENQQQCLAIFLHILWPFRDFQRILGDMKTTRKLYIASRLYHVQRHGSSTGTHHFQHRTLQTSNPPSSLKDFWTEFMGHELLITKLVKIVNNEGSDVSRWYEWLIWVSKELSTHLKWVDNYFTPFLCFHSSTNKYVAVGQPSILNSVAQRMIKSFRF